MSRILVEIGVKIEKQEESRGKTKKDHGRDGRGVR